MALRLPVYRDFKFDWALTPYSATDGRNWIDKKKLSFLFRKREKGIIIIEQCLAGNSIRPCRHLLRRRKREKCLRLVLVTARRL